MVPDDPAGRGRGLHGQADATGAEQPCSALCPTLQRLPPCEDFAATIKNCQNHFPRMESIGVLVKVYFSRETEPVGDI